MVLRGKPHGAAPRNIKTIMPSFRVIISAVMALSVIATSCASVGGTRLRSGEFLYGKGYGKSMHDLTAYREAEKNAYADLLESARATFGEKAKRLPDKTTLKKRYREAVRNLITMTLPPIVFDTENTRRYGGIYYTTIIIKCHRCSYAGRLLAVMREDGDIGSQFEKTAVFRELSEEAALCRE